MATKRKRKEDNAWLEADKKHRRNIVLGSLAALLVVVVGVLLLIHALRSN